MATVESTVTTARGLAGLRFVLTIAISRSRGLAGGGCDGTYVAFGWGLQMGLYQKHLQRGRLLFVWGVLALPSCRSRGIEGRVD